MTSLIEQFGKSVEPQRAGRANPPAYSTGELADAALGRGRAGLRNSEPAGQRRVFAANGCELGDPASGGCGELGRQNLPRSRGPDGLAHDDERGRSIERASRLHADGQPGDNAAGCGPTNGYWAGAEWIACSDGKARPVEPGTFPLVDGAPARLVRLRAYGNAIPAPVAEEFIRAYLEVTTPHSPRNNS